MIKTLDRRLGLSAVIAISIGSMLGSGIFVLPGVAFELTGPSFFLAYILAAACILPAAVSKSELATAMPTSGGTYVYLERTFGPLAGTVSGLGLWLSLLLKAAFALVGFGAYLEVMANVPIHLTSLSLLAFIVLINIAGVGKASSFVAIIVATCLVSLAALCTGAFFSFEPSHFSNPLPQGTSGLMAATALVFVAFAGVTKVAAIAEEIKDPGRNLPRGILISLFLVSAIFGLVSFFMAGVLTPAELSGNIKPVYTMALKIGGEQIGIIASVIAILTMTSMANAGLLAASRFPFAMGRDRLLPSVFGKIDSKFLTPIWSIIVSSLVIGSAIAVLDVEKIAKLASVFMILIYAAENIAVIVLRETRVQWYKPEYKSFAYPLLQIFGIVSSAFLLYAMGSVVPTAILLVSVPGIILYLTFGRQRTDRRGVLGIRGPRRDLIEDSSTTSNKKRIEEIKFTEDAKVVVALFGKERTPEVLTEMGAALAAESKLEVVHLTEVPEQTTLSDMSEESQQTQAIRRRVNHMSERQNSYVSFDAVISHDILKTVNDISQGLHCSWMLVEWGGKTRGALTLHNPMGWLRDHLSCHLMTFRDKGVRYFKNIMVIVKTEKSNMLLLNTANHLAAVFGADITLVGYVKQEASTETKEWQKELLEGMKLRCPSAVDTRILTKNLEWEAYTCVTNEFDMVIMEAEKVTSFYQRFFGSTYDKVMQHSSCSVVSIQTTTDMAQARGLKQRFLARPPATRPPEMTH